MASTEFAMYDYHIGIDYSYTPNSNTIVYVPMRNDFSDHSSNGIAITNTGSVSLANNIGGAKIAVGNFGSGKRLSFTNPTNMNQAFTVSAWMYVRSFASVAAVCFGQGTNSSNSGLHLTAGMPTSGSRGMVFGFYGNDYDSGVWPTANAWHLVTFTYDGSSTATIYLDNTKVGSKALTKYTGTGKNGVIGTYSWDTTSYSEEYMSEFFIENGAKSLTNIQTYYNNSKYIYGL